MPASFGAFAALSEPPTRYRPMFKPDPPVLLRVSTRTSYSLVDEPDPPHCELPTHSRAKSFTVNFHVPLASSFGDRVSIALVLGMVKAPVQGELPAEKAGRRLR